jgi:hypothetical protein
MDSDMRENQKQNTKEQTFKKQNTKEQKSKQKRQKLKFFIENGFDLVKLEGSSG